MAVATPKKTHARNSVTKTPAGKNPDSIVKKTPPRTRSTPSKSKPQLNKETTPKNTPIKSESDKKEFATPKSNTKANNSASHVNNKATPAKNAAKHTPSKANGKAAHAKPNTKDTPQVKKQAKNASNVEKLDSIVADLDRDSKEEAKQMQHEELVESEAESTSQSGSSDDNESGNELEVTDGSEESDEEEALEEVKSSKKSNQAAYGEKNNTAEKKVSFANETETASKPKSVYNQAPKDLKDEFALVIKGLNFKCKAEDIRRRLTKVHYIRMPSNASNPGQNNGYCFAYFESLADVDEAYQSLRKDPKILARQCFVRYLKPKSNSEDKNKDREVDPNALYIKNLPRFDKNPIENVKNLFPESNYTYVQKEGKKCFAVIGFKNPNTCSNYLNKTINYRGVKLNIALMFKPTTNETSQKRTAPGATTEIKAKVQKTNDNKPVSKKNTTFQSIKKQENSDENGDNEDSSSDEDAMDLKVDGSTDSNDESFEEESSD